MTTILSTDAQPITAATRPILPETIDGRLFLGRRHFLQAVKAPSVIAVSARDQHAVDCNTACWSTLQPAHGTAHSPSCHASTTTSTAKVVPVNAISPMAPRRWLWPCSDSHVLRLPAYQKPSLQACLIHPENPDQILVHDSDDDLDDNFHSAKRRRIESIAHAFLNGQPIYIPSARLRGPFPADRDLSTCYDLSSSPDEHPVSPPPAVTADTFIRRRPEHLRPKSITPDTALTPSKPRQSSPVATERPISRPQSSRHSPRLTTNKSLRFNVPSSAPSEASTVLPPLPQFVAINKVSLQARNSPNQPPTSTVPSSRVRIPDTDFVSPSPPPSKDDISPSKAAVLRQRPASLLNKIGKIPSSTGKLPSVKKNKRPTKRVYQAATSFDTTSPFIYRKNAAQSRKVSELASSNRIEPEEVIVEPKQVRIDLGVTPGHSQHLVSHPKRHHVLFESSLDVPNPKQSREPLTADEPVPSPDRTRHDRVPAINMSFGQESFGMDFNLLNGSLPTSSRRSNGVDVDVDNQNSPPAVVAPNLSAQKPLSDTNEAQSGQSKTGEVPSTDSNETELSVIHPDEENGDVSGPAANTSAVVNGDLLDVPMQDNIVDDGAESEEDVAEELPYISTQAAMQDAHRALFDASSPLQPQEGKSEVPFETPAKQVTSPPSSPIHTITPFHQFNAELTTDTQAPLPNTQALFDGFYSPIKLSARKPKTAKRASFAPSVILEDVDDTVTSIFDFPDDHIVRENKEPEVEPEQDDAPTTTNHGVSPVQDPPSPIGAQDQANPPSPEETSRPLISPANRSESPDFILSQRTEPPTRESAGHTLPAFKQDSVSLSEVLNFVSQRRGIDVDTLLSQTTPTSSSRSLDKTNRTSARSSGTRPRSSLPKSRSSQSNRPLPEKRVGQRRSMRISLSQPIRQLDGADDASDTELDVDGPPATQPNLGFAGSGRSFALTSFDVPDGSSTIPDPSLAFNHAQQNATPASERLAFTPGSAPQSTGQISSYQHAQKHYSSLTDLDSTMPDLPQTFLPPVR
ncbi:hypothetical protein KCU81_g2930, partial [Aureobasidium melanogenum]|uniref:Uncharacterized protein n=1 Tax=Aureobasidium melanogenum (strain CBS 110374) TaxID=1043003 RepID=A0A074VDM0_AURM1